MKIMYLAFANSAHTLKWVNYFKKKHEIMLVSFYDWQPIERVDLRYLPVRNKNLAIFKANRVKRLINEFKPDILHAHFASSCGLVAALTGFHPYILSVWGDDILVFPNKSVVHKRAVKYAINSADYLTATSNMLREHTKKLMNKQREITIIPFGVDLQHFAPVERTPKGIVHVGTVRGLTPKYGVEYLIKAVGQLIKNGKNLKLTIVGDGPIRGELENLASSLGIKERIYFAGFIPNEKVVSFLNEFDIFAIPSVGEGETFGVAAVEAMATALPVVASRVGGLPEVIDDRKTGMLVQPANVMELAKALEIYASKPDLRITHGQAGRRKVEAQYNLEENAILMDNLYDTAMANRNFRTQ